jgi:hypothetical protein
MRQFSVCAFSCSGMTDKCPASLISSQMHRGGGVPCAGEEAWDSCDAGADEVAEVQLREVGLHMRLQHFCPQGALQSQQGTIVVHLHLRLPTIPLHRRTPQFSTIDLICFNIVCAHRQSEGILVHTPEYARLHSKQV